MQILEVIKNLFRGNATPPARSTDAQHGAGPALAAHSKDAVGKGATGQNVKAAAKK